MGGGMYRKLEVVGIGSGWADLTELRGKDILCLQIIYCTYGFLITNFRSRLPYWIIYMASDAGKYPFVPVPLTEYNPRYDAFCCVTGLQRARNS